MSNVMAQFGWLSAGPIPAEFDLRKIMQPAREAMKKVVAERMVQFGQAGQASKLKPIPLDQMTKKYV